MAFVNGVLHYVPQRIVSLVPSQTELLFDLGLGEAVVGITKFCVHPESWFKTKTRVGGTKTVDLEKLISLKPDLIIANKEENVKEQVEALANLFPVWVTDVENVQDACGMIGTMGRITGRTAEAEMLLTQISTGFTELKEAVPADAVSPRCVYLIWKNPYMTVGGDTFISDMLHRCGLVNLFAMSSRYPVVELPELKDGICDLILLSSEPYPFRERHLEEIRNELPGVKVELVDGEMFSWYGSRLASAAGYLKKILPSFY